MISRPPGLSAPTLPDDTVDRFLAAWRAGDFEACRGLVAEDCEFYARTKGEHATLVGFDAFLEFHARRRQQMNVTSWHPVQRSSGDRHVAVVARMREGEQVWQALSVYEIDGDVITALWLHEPF